MTWKCRIELFKLLDKKYLHFINICGKIKIVVRDVIT